MKNIEIEGMDEYEYGFNLGFKDGRVAKIRNIFNDEINRVLSQNDPYALGFKKGYSLPSRPSLEDRELFNDNN